MIKISTIKDIAKETGLGIATISKYLNGGNVLPENELKIKKAIKKYNYSINQIAKGLRTKESMMIGIVIPRLDDIFATTIITVIEELLRKAGYATVVCDCNEDEKIERDAMRFLVSKQIDGAIVLSTCRTDKNLKIIRDHGIPVVLVDRNVKNNDGYYNTVLVDNIEAAQIATDYLVKRGHKNIGMIVGPINVYTAAKRFEGYRITLKKNSIKYEPSYTVFCPYSVQGGFDAMNSLLDKKPDITAVIANNYDTTLGAIMALNKRKLRMAEDISLVGFDNLLFATIVEPKLTIITQPMITIGELSANLLLKRLKGKNHEDNNLVLKVFLQEGGSVKTLL